MSESSQEKTKRKYVSWLTDYQWNYQCSVFYQSPADSIHLLADMKQFKQKLRRKLPELPLLIRVCLLNREKELQAYLTIHTTDAVRADIEACAITTLSMPVNVIGRRRSTESIQSAASAISSQKPHNLQRFFGNAKINRYSLLNKQRLMAKI